MEGHLSAEEAAAAIREAAAWDEAIRARTLGLTWLLWGVIVPSVYLTFSYAAAMVREYPPWFGLLWMPWSAAGVVVTWLLWRSAALVLNEGALAGRRLARMVLLFLVSTIGGVIAVFALKLPLLPPAVTLFGIGVLSIGFGWGSALRHNREAAALLLGGALLVGVAVWESVVLARAPFMDGVHQAALWNAPTAAVVFFAVGILTYSRG